MEAALKKRTGIAALLVFSWVAPADAKDGHGLNLDKPGLIDAVATILYPYQGQEAFTRVDDDTVLLELPDRSILQLKRLHRVGVPIGVNALEHLQGIVAEGIQVLQADDKGEMS